METSVLTIVLSFALCAAVTFLLLSTKACKPFFEEKVLSSAFAVSVSVLLLTAINAVFFWQPFDFVANISPLQYLLPLLCLPLIFGAFFIKFSFAVPFALLASCAISVFISGLTVDFFSANPLYINQILTTLLFWGFAIGFRTMAGINTLPQIQGMTVCIGLSLLCILGQAPLMLSSSASGLFGALAVSYFLNAKIPLGTNAAPILGYILGWLGLVSYQELLWPCFLIFSMFYLIEAFVAFFRKATFLPQYRDIAYNSLLFQSLKEEIPVATLVKLIISSCVVLVVLGLFQTASSNMTSLPLFAAVLVIWELYRALNWRQENKTLKETNKELISQIKASVSNLFSSQQKNNDTDKNK